MKISTDNLVAERLRSMPVNPGVYLMKNAAGEIIYVGKASCLRNRVRSYFTGSDLTPKTLELVRHILDIEFYITGSEEEALLLELNLIKRHRPHYNIRLKDDKGYPYIKIDLSEEWPRVQITRNVTSDKSRYFGPFASAYSIRQALGVIKSIFPFRSCDIVLNGQPQRPCLEHDMRHCVAPCAGKITHAEYNEIIQGVIQFLDGKQSKLEKDLVQRMKQAAEARRFEQAGYIRDQLRAMREVINWQRLSSRVRGDMDVVAFQQQGDQAYVQVYFVRGSKLIGRDGFVLNGTGAEPPDIIMNSFVQQYYAVSQNTPPLILLQYPVTDSQVITAWLSRRRGGPVKIVVPKRGERKVLLDNVAENAHQGLEQLRIKQLAQSNTITAALAELKDILKLPDVPHRIEGYDISNIQGQMAVGSMVVFEEGKPRPTHYRRFRIKTVPQANDFAMLSEVMSRRFSRIKAETADGDWTAWPDLVLIDGGKGQLSAAREAMEKVGAGHLQLASLAKENEEIFIPGHSPPIRLQVSSPGRQLLQRIRDESHRFALGYHHNLRKKHTFTSALDNIPGIGPYRKKVLLKHFGTVTKIREAALEEIQAVPGFSSYLARMVKENI
jgi:excinuclease ABC subunit C